MAKQFKFRLQKVLEYRSRICDDLRQELERCNALHNEAEQHLAYLRSCADSLQLPFSGTNPASSNGVSTTTIDQVVLVGDFALRLKLETEQQVAKIAEIQLLVDAARDRYVDAKKDLQALESLRESRRAEYTHFVMKEEEKILDEQTVQRYSRK